MGSLKASDSKGSIVSTWLSLITLSPALLVRPSRTESALYGICTTLYSPIRHGFVVALFLFLEAEARFTILRNAYSILSVRSMASVTFLTAAPSQTYTKHGSGRRAWRRGEQRSIFSQVRKMRNIFL
jgi:hypothetical protein